VQAWVGAAVAATERVAQAFFAAAMALPGLATTVNAIAATPPTGASLELQYSHYQEFQSGGKTSSGARKPGAKRMKIDAPSLFIVAPIGESWSASGFLTTDSISGASPLYHDTLSGASGEGIDDFRVATNANVTRYFDRATLSVGGAYSKEDDYLGRALSASASIDSADRNTTYSAGVAFNRDRIDSTNGIAQNLSRRGEQLNVGITRVLSSTSLMAASIGFAHGEGYFNDPYKPLDKRPDGRDETTFLLRYNQFFAGPDAALRLSYRYYTDTWSLAGHTLDAAWEQSLPNDFVLTPSLRYYRQSKADFYVEPPFGSGYAPGRNYSADTRLSAFGAWNAGLKLGFPEWAGWRAELKFEFYRQKAGFGVGLASDGLAALSARTFQLGLKHDF
jgi:hypothetical protein